VEWGLTTGDGYRGTGVTETQFNIASGADSYTYVITFRIIERGPGPGNVTASVSQTSMACR
jgi:hypothetical protein